MTVQGVEVQPPTVEECSKVFNSIKLYLIDDIDLQVAMPVKETEVQSLNDGASCKVESLLKLLVDQAYQYSGRHVCGESCIPVFTS